MTTQTTAITLTGSGAVTNSSTTTVTTTGPAVVNPGYSSSYTQTFTNAGTLYSTGTGNGGTDSGIEIAVDRGAAGQNNSITNTGLISGYNYGILLGGGNAASPEIIRNSGSIVARGGANGNSAGIFSGNNVVVTVTNSSLISGAEGVFLQTDDTGVQVVNNLAGGTISGTTVEGSEGFRYAIKIQDITNGLQGTGNIYNAGLINGFIDDAAKYGNLTNASTGTITQGLLVFGTGTLTLDAGESVGGLVRFADGKYSSESLSLATLVLGGAAGTIGNVADPGSFTGFGSITVTAGADWTLGTSSSSAGFSGVSTIDNFGTVNLAGALTGNTIDMEGSIAGTSTKVEFTGTNTSTPIVDYGANDQIVLDNLPSGSGTSYKDSYNTATGVLTVTEYNAAGASIGSDTITVSAAPGVTIAPNGSFIEISGPGGPTIVLGSSSLGNSGSIFIDDGESYTLTNTAGTDTIPVTFGSNGTSLALNTLDINGTVSGTNSPYQGTISGFGLNDDIILGPSVLPAVAPGDSVSLSYAGGLLTVTELNVNGNSIGSTTLDVGTGYSTGSFLALLGTNGVNIETPATVDEKPLTFNASGSADFETPTDYTGGLAPGSSIVTGETVIIASGTAVVSVTAPVTNSGTILVSGSSSGFIDRGTLSGNGTIIATAGGSVTLAADTGTVDFGTATAGAPNVVDLNGSPTGFTGTIAGFGVNDDIVLGTSVLAAGGAGTSYADSYNTATGVLTVSELNAAGSVVGSTSLTVANTGGTLTSGSFVDIAGPNGVTIALASSQLGNAGSIFIDHGQHVTLSNTTGVDTIPVTFGANGTSLALNVLDLNGTVSGTNSPYQGTISGFGLNDDIILGPSVLPSVATGDTVTLSYTGSLLTVTELNINGNSIGSTTLDVGTGYATGSFVALLGANGINIETPQTVDEQSFNFGPLTGGTTYQGDFENPNDYAGGLAPGATIIAGETVTVQEPAQANVTTSLTNNGLIVLDALNANMDATAAISGTGTIEVGGGSDLILANTTGSTTDTIAFTGNGLLDLAGTGTASFAGTITGEAASDKIELGASFLPTPTAASAVSLSFNTTSGVLSISDTVGGTVYTDTLHFAGPVANDFSASVNNGFIVISDIPCFAAGTRILTGWGSRKVEDLAVGDEVLSARDGRGRKIIWAGHRTVDLSRHANPDKAIPVLITAGAFGDSLPERDLRVSPDHALYIEGCLIEAKTLVNGTTILRDRTARFVTYHHIELESHDVVLAEGLPAETYLDSGNRRNFESGAGPLALHPDFAAASRAGSCADLLLDGEIVRQARQKLLDRAFALGFRRTDAIDLVALINGDVIAPHADDTGRALIFVLPADASRVTLLSSTGVPAETSADPGDRRVLGVAVTELALITGGRRILIDLNGAHEGFHAAEAGQRWTAGKASIALPTYAGRAVLEVSLAGQAARWLAPSGVREFANV
jgi:hypothetical protein